MASVILAPIHTRLLETWTMIARGHTQQVNTGNTTENTLASFTLPGGSLGPNGILRVWSLWSNANSNANTKTPRVRLAGTEFGSFGITTQLSWQTMTMIRNRNSESSQISHALGQNGLGTSTTAPVTGAINTASDQTVTLTAQLGNGTDSMALESWLAEVLYGD